MKAEVKKILKDPISGKVILTIDLGAESQEEEYELGWLRNDDKPVHCSDLKGEVRYSSLRYYLG